MAHRVGNRDHPESDPSEELMEIGDASDAGGDQPLHRHLSTEDLQNAENNERERNFAARNAEKNKGDNLPQHSSSADVEHIHVELPSSHDGLGGKASDDKPADVEMKEDGGDEKPSKNPPAVAKPRYEWTQPPLAGEVKGLLIVQNGTSVKGSELRLDSYPQHSGRFGQLYKAQHPNLGYISVWRLKMLRNPPEEIRFYDIFVTLASQLIKLNHINLISVFGYLKNYCLVTEYERFVSLENISYQVFVPWPMRVRIIVELADAMAYLHGKGIVHMHLSHQVILLTENYHVKLSGSCMTKWMSAIRSVSPTLAYEKGSLIYENEDLMDKSTDVYMYGVLVFKMFTSKSPFPSLDYQQMTEQEKLQEALKIGLRPDTSAWPAHFDHNICDVVLQSCHHRDSSRPSFSEIKESLYENAVKYRDVAESSGVSAIKAQKNSKDNLDNLERSLSPFDADMYGMDDELDMMYMPGRQNLKSAILNSPDRYDLIYSAITAMKSGSYIAKTFKDIYDDVLSPSELKSCFAYIDCTEKSVAVRHLQEMEQKLRSFDSGILTRMLGMVLDERTLKTQSIRQLVLKIYNQSMPKHSKKKDRQTPSGMPEYHHMMMYDRMRMRRREPASNFERSKDAFKLGDPMRKENKMRGSVLDDQWEVKTSGSAYSGVAKPDEGLRSGVKQQPKAAAASTKTADPKPQQDKPKSSTSKPAGSQPTGHAGQYSSQSYAQYRTPAGSGPRMFGFTQENPGGGNRGYYEHHDPFSNTRIFLDNVDNCYIQTEPGAANVYSGTGVTNMGSFFNPFGGGAQQSPPRPARGAAVPAPAPPPKLTKSTREIETKDMDRIAAGVKGNWKRLARTLNMDQADMDVIEHDYQKEGSYEQAYQTLFRWKQKRLNEATACNVAEVLHSIGMTELAQSIQ